MNFSIKSQSLKAFLITQLSQTTRAGGGASCACSCSGAAARLTQKGSLSQNRQTLDVICTEQTSKVTLYTNVADRIYKMYVGNVDPEDTE